MLASSYSSALRHNASASGAHKRASSTSPARYDGRVSATVRAIGLVVLMFGALICGLWAGMTGATDLAPAEKGVMDTPY
jgi:hypothetical protein